MKWAKLYINQYGERFYARTLRELKESVGGGKIEKMFRDSVDGKSYHVGYVIGGHGGHWLTEYTQTRNPI